MLFLSLSFRWVLVTYLFSQEESLLFLTAERISSMSYPWVLQVFSWTQYLMNFWALLLLWICTDFGISVNFGDLVIYILKSKGRKENILKTWKSILKLWAPTCSSWRLCSSKSSFIPSKSSGAWISANFIRFNERPMTND